MNTSVLIGLRFLRSKAASGFLSLVTKVSVFGLMLGVMALVIVVSVMNGFDSQLKYRILGASPHIVLSQEPETESSRVIQQAPFLRHQGMLLGTDSRLVTIFGIDPELEPEISVIPNHLIEGELTDLKPGANKLILGASLASRLALWPGEQTTIMIPVASSSGASVVPRVARGEVAGVFRLDSELDYSLVLMHVEDLQAVTKADIHYRLTLKDIFDLQSVQQANPGQVVATWADDYGDFFAAVKMEKIMMFLLLTLIVAIAAFNTVSGLSMMVKEKQGEIAVLRTMGLTPKDITTIFVIQGSVVGLSGVILGLIVGLPLAYHVSEIVGFVEDLLGGRMLAGTYFDRVPSDVRWFDILVIALVSMAIAVLATLYPAYQAGRLKPAEVLRSE